MALGLTQQIQTIMLINIAHCNQKRVYCTMRCNNNIILPLPSLSLTRSLDRSSLSCEFLKYIDSK